MDSPSPVESPVAMSSKEVQVRQNYDTNCEREVNNHINLELHNSYVYLSIGYYFLRADVALKHFSRFFLRLSQDAKGRAEKLMQLQVLRGTSVTLFDIKKPHRDEWADGLTAMDQALCLERNVNHSLMNLHQLAADYNDAHLRDFIERYFLHEQVNTIKEVGDHAVNLRNMGAPNDSMAEYLFDRLTLGAAGFKE